MGNCRDGEYLFYDKRLSQYILVATRIADDFLNGDETFFPLIDIYRNIFKYMMSYSLKKVHDN